MRFLLFLLLGTLIFGMKFPAFMLFVIIAFIVIAGMIIYKLMSGGVLHYQSYSDKTDNNERIYSDTTTGGNGRGAAKHIDADMNPSHKNDTVSASACNVATDEDELDDGGEIIDIPESSLHKDGE